MHSALPMTAAAGRPIVIQAGDRMLAGFHHVPASAERSVGFVLCNPLGYEFMCVYRTYRHLAERLALAGFHVLRFDYHGTGNSSGHDGQAFHLVEDVHAAIDALKQRANLEQVALAGIRAGALLAASAAGARSDVASLVLLAMPSSGRAHVRELKAFASIAASAQQATEDDTLRMVGFALTPAMLEQLNGIDPSRITLAGSRRLLLLRRDDLPGEDRLAKVFREAGHDVTVDVIADYANILSTAETTVLPVPMIDTICKWADGALLEHTGRGPAAVPRDPELLSEDGAVEVGVHFPSHGSALFGVLTRPLSAGDRTARRAVILLGTGANHQIGAGRLNVHLARQLAAMGVTVLRFDSSGIGESPARAGCVENDVYHEGGTDDVLSALAFMRQRLRTEEFVLMGTCSGAYHSFTTAVRAPQVIAQLLVNIATFDPPKTQKFEERLQKSFRSRAAYARTALELKTWRRLLAGEVAVVRIGEHLSKQLARTAVSRSKALVSTYLFRNTPTNRIERDFHFIGRRGVRTKFVYAARASALDTLNVYLGPMAERLTSLKDCGEFTIHTVEDADHTFTKVGGRAELVGIALEFVRGLG